MLNININNLLPIHKLQYLDVDDVKFVVNYDYPNSSEEYIHRIGRTARNNRTGTAYTLFTIQNASKANDLISVLKEANQVSSHFCQTIVSTVFIRFQIKSIFVLLRLQFALRSSIRAFWIW